MTAPRIAPIEMSELESVRSLILSCAKDCSDDFSGEGWLRFLASNDIAATKKRIEDPEYRFLGAWVNCRLVGVATLYQQEKIEQLFVLREHRGQGVARLLWQALIEGVAQNSRLWVRSSSLAVPIYKRLGFQQDSDRQEFKGIFFTPMSLTLP